MKKREISFQNVHFFSFPFSEATFRSGNYEVFLSMINFKYFLTLSYYIKQAKNFNESINLYRNKVFQVQIK